MALQRLKESSEKAKIELSTVLETEINLPYITADATGPKHLVIKLSRAKLEQLTEDLVERTIGPCRLALEDAGLNASEVGDIILVGGMTRMPAVQEAVRTFFGKETHKGVNPDEVVAIGAAIQGGVLAGDVKDILLLDVTPLTLAIETLGGVATPMIDRNTTIPTKKMQPFTTASHNQTQVEISVTQGERPLSKDNKLLGHFILDGIPPAPRGVPQIEVTFDIDANGILHVTAHDKATGREQSIKITASSGLSDSEIGKMVEEAEAHKADDEARRQLIESRNRADAVTYQTEKAMNEAGDNLPVEIKQELDEKLAAVRAASANEDPEAIETCTNELLESAQKIGQHMYSQAAAEAAAAPAAETPEPDVTPQAEPDSETSPETDGDEDDVVDADFRESE